jgi:steroid delta-isomerase-like uncharacterized protein
MTDNYQERNKKLARKVFEDVQTEGNVALIEELVTRDYVGHTPLGDIHGPQGARQFDATLHKAFPDLKIEVESQIAEGDRVATRWTCRATHQGEFQGIPPTGKEITMRGITVFRFGNGKMIEGWTNPDLFSVLRQLDAIPAPERSA